MSDYPLGLQGRPFPYHVDTTADHWWPKGLQRLWAAPDGYLSRIKPNGAIDKKKPPNKGRGKGFAHSIGGHRVVFGASPWNHSFEPEFDWIDDKGPPTLRALEKRVPGEKEDIFAPSSAIRTSDILFKLCFSLLIRSPSFRDRYAHAGKAFGLEYDRETGKANISHFWNSAKEIDLSKCNSATLTMLRSKDAEFCFGDGLYDTIFTRPLTWRASRNDWISDLSGDALVPLLPNLCAYLHFTRKSRGFRVQELHVSPDVVAEANTLTQTYSKEQLFFRSKPPTLDDAYKRCIHLTVSPESSPFVSTLRARIGRTF